LDALKKTEVKKSEKNGMRTKKVKKRYETYQVSENATENYSLSEISKIKNEKRYGTIKIGLKTQEK
jgi:methyl coenzyme M reductase subunit C-like uncharacterized protein (methanogenesis marker protein 7)